MPAPLIAVTLDRERTLSFTNLARYRMATLPQPFELRDLTNRKKSYGALVAWLWACLTEEAHADFPSPEKLAEHITEERAVAAVTALGRAIEEAAPKNASGSTPGPLPASSSVSPTPSSGRSRTKSTAP